MRKNILPYLLRALVWILFLTRITAASAAPQKEGEPERGAKKSKNSSATQSETTPRDEFYRSPSAKMVEYGLVKPNFDVYTIGYGHPNLDMYTGAYNIHAVYNGYFDLKGSYVRNELVSDVMVFLADAPVAIAGSVLQHEYFGHGYWCRVYDIPYKTVIFPPFPYNLLSEKTINAPGGYVAPGGSPPNLDGLIQMVAGGMEANTIAARAIREQYLVNHSLGFAGFYTINKLSPLYYIITGSGSTTVGKINGQDTTGDPALLQNLYAAKYRNKTALPTNSFRLHALWTFIDPVVITTLPYVGRHIAKLLPRLGLVETGSSGAFMWGSNYFLTPYGEQFDLDLIFFDGSAYYAITPKLGNGIEQAFFGLAARARRVVKAGALYLGLGLESWLQPKYRDGNGPENGLAPGGAGSLIAEYQLRKKFFVFAEGGYKSYGYMSGRALEAETFAFFGVNFATQ